MPWLKDCDDDYINLDFVSILWVRCGCVNEKTIFTVVAKSQNGDYNLANFDNEDNALQYLTNIMLELHVLDCR
jgi:hypothetical protein